MTFRINGNKKIEHNNIKAKIGLTDKNIHTTFYVEGGGFITPETEFKNFNEIMDDIQSFCKRSTKNKLFKNELLDSCFLLNFEVCSDRMKKGKQTYLSFQYHFKQRYNNNISVLDIKKENESFFISLLDDLESELNSYQIKITKNKKK